MRTWSGVITIEGEQTGDGRVTADGALYWENLPLTLGWSPTGGGHVDTVPVGTVDVIERRENGRIWGSGMIDDEGEAGAEAVRLMDNRMLRGVSIVPDDWEIVVVDTTMTEADLAEAEDEIMALFAAAGDPDPGPDAGVVLFEDETGAVVERLVRARIRKLDLVDLPADIDAEITLDPIGGEMGETDGDAENEMALTAAVIGSTDLPVAARDTDWDGSGATTRVFELCTSEGGEVDEACVARAFVLRDDDADPQTQAAYSLGFADVINDQLQIVPDGVVATAGGRGISAVEGISAEERDRAEARICGLYDRVREEHDDFPDCPLADDNDNSSEATTAAAGHDCGCGDTCTTCGTSNPTRWSFSVIASGIPESAFAMPKLSDRTPIDSDGERVFGHVASHDTCHVGLPGCTTAPFSARGYVDFHRYSHTAAGRELPVTAGRITGGHGEWAEACRCCRGNDDHACRNLSLGGTIAHHDALSTLAYVRAGEDETNNAIWVAGIIAPEATDADRALLSRRMLSGDWRDIAGKLELTEVLALSREKPGFPIALVASGGRPMSLQAAGMILDRPNPDLVISGLNPETAAQIGREAAQHFLDELDRRHHEEDRREAEPIRARLQAAGAEHWRRKLRRVS